VTEEFRRTCRKRKYQTLQNVTHPSDGGIVPMLDKLKETKRFWNEHRSNHPYYRSRDMASSNRAIRHFSNGEKMIDPNFVDAVQLICGTWLIIAVAIVVTHGLGLWRTLIYHDVNGLHIFQELNDGNVYLEIVRDEVELLVKLMSIKDWLAMGLPNIACIRKAGQWPTPYPLPPPRAGMRYHAPSANGWQ
jgi:hypothetical protein